MVAYKIVPTPGLAFIVHRAMKDEIGIMEGEIFRPNKFKDGFNKFFERAGKLRIFYPCFRDNSYLKPGVINVKVRLAFGMYELNPVTR